MLYCGLTAYGIVPTLHWIYLNGGLSTEIVQVGTWGHILCAWFKHFLVFDIQNIKLLQLYF